MKLHYRVIGEGEPLFIIHGLFGSSDNWQTLGKRFAEHFKVYFVDQRNHGRSPHSDEFGYPEMVSDFYELVTDLGEDNINILGHSMGGKTAIGFAVDYPEMINRMIVADISHKEYEHQHEPVLDGLNAIDLSTVKSRTEAERLMEPFVPDWGTRQFLLKNLYWVEKGQLGWRINLPVLTRDLQKVVDEIDFYQIETETLFIRGGKSHYIPDEDLSEIQFKFPRSFVETMQGSGHWVHADNPELFYKLVMDFLSS